MASSLIKPSYRGRKSLSSQIIPKEFGGRQARVYIKNRIANNPVSQCSGFGRPDGRVGRAEVRSPFQSSRSPTRKHFCLPPAPHPSRGGLQRQAGIPGHSFSPYQHQEVVEVKTDPARSLRPQLLPSAWPPPANLESLEVKSVSRGTSPPQCLQDNPLPVPGSKLLFRDFFISLSHFQGLFLGIRTACLSRFTFSVYLTHLDLSGKIISVEGLSRSH